MSEVTIYDSSVGLFIGGLTSLISILKKAQLQPDASTFPSAKLIDDMKPLSFQVESAIKTISRCMARAAAIDVETVECNEMNMEELIAFAEKTLQKLKSIEPKSLEGKEATKIELSLGTFTGKQFIFGFGIPSFFFHWQTAYAILRMKGVPVGKADYMDPFKAPFMNA
jgi:hypothetical protein